MSTHFCRPILHLLSKTVRDVKEINVSCIDQKEYRLCGLVVRVLGYRSGGPGSIPGTTRKK
jgi:hypothetical protein